MNLISTSNDRSFPYVGAPGWLSRLHELFQRSVPSRVDADWLTSPDRFSEKFSRANASQLLSFMEKVGWIDTDGNVLEEGRQLRLVGEPYERAMKALIDRWYPDLLAQIEGGQITSPEGVENFFVTTTTMGKSGRQQMIAVFRWFLREAGLASADQKIWGEARRAPAHQVTTHTRDNGASPRSTRQASKGSSRPTSGKRPATKPHEDLTGATVDSTVDHRLATISSVLKINIDGSWDEERMKAAFHWLDQLIRGDGIE